MFRSLPFSGGAKHLDQDQGSASPEGQEKMREEELARAWAARVGEDARDQEPGRKGEGRRPEPSLQAPPTPGNPGALRRPPPGPSPAPLTVLSLEAAGLPHDSHARPGGGGLQDFPKSSACRTLPTL